MVNATNIENCTEIMYNRHMHLYLVTGLDVFYIFLVELFTLYESCFLSILCFCIFFFGYLISSSKIQTSTELPKLNTVSARKNLKPS